MKVVLQRVSEANVKIDGQIEGKIEKGILALLGIHNDDIGNDAKIDKMLDKIINLRIFEDENDKLNLSLKDVDGELLIVSNFTLYGDCRKGTRPSYTDAAKPSLANEYYDKFIEKAKALDIKNVECGVFGADMKVNLINDGPVTICYEL